jgi:hypothetical protein
MNAPELWTSAEFADYAKVTVAQVAHLRRSGKGPTFIKIGKHVRYVPGVVHRWVLDRQQATTKVDAK